jgi:hypothetical protein
MSERAESIQRDEVKGPGGEIVRISWFADKRVRFDFLDFGKLAVTKIFPNPGRNPKTNVEVSYGLEE